MHDIDYNPFNDKQAQDRCHRVGQTRFDYFISIYLSLITVESNFYNEITFFFYIKRSRSLQTNIKKFNRRIDASNTREKTGARIGNKW